MKRKGFTLVELLAVIIILGSLAVIIAPQVMRYITNAREEAYDESIKAIKRATQQYLLDNDIPYPTVEGERITVTIEQLKPYLDNVINPITKEPFADDVVVVLVDGGYYYSYGGKPIITFSINGTNDYVRTIGTVVTVEAINGVDDTSLKYVWTNSESEPAVESFTNSFVNGTAVDTPAVSGIYHLWIYAKDMIGNTTITASGAFKLDNTAPVITINGSNPHSQVVSGSYVDAGATSLDNLDGNLTSSISTTSTVVSNIFGTYKVTYRSTDRVGNVGTAERVVTIIDNVIPTVAFGTNGNATYAKTYSTTVTVTDNGALNTNSFKYLWKTNTTTPLETDFFTSFTNGQSISVPAGVSGGYYLWIIAKDSSGATAITRSNVFNLDNTGPVITINGTNPLTIQAGSTYTDAGATSTDAVSGSRTVTTSGSVNPSIPGTYTITYTSSDALGNSSTASRTVNVIDTNGPNVAFGTNGNTNYGKTYSTTVTATDAGAGVITLLKYQWTNSTTAPTEASFTTSFTNGATLATPSNLNGGYYLWIIAKDNSNNTIITRSNVFNLDNTVPTAPSIAGGNSTWKNTDSSINITSGTDALSGVAKSQYSIDNTNWSDYSTTLSYTTSTNITLYARTVDNAGNISSSTTATVMVDKNAPTCTVSGGSSTWTNATRTVTGTCSDTGGSGCNGTNPSYTYSTQMSITTAGAAGNGVGGTVSDAAGNTTTCAANQTVYIDKTAPTVSGVTNSSSGAWVNVNVTLGWDAADTGGSGFQQMQFSYDKVTINPSSITQPTIGATSWVNASAVWSAQRNNTVYFRITDRAGNVSAWTTGTAVKIDKTAPTLTVNNTSSGCDGSATLTNKTDASPSSGFPTNYIRWKVNGTYTAWGTTTSNGVSGSSSTLYLEVMDVAGNITSQIIKGAGCITEY